MARIVVVLVVLATGAAAGALMFAHGSQAAPREAAVAIQRTFVSTGGSDANPCTAAQPCRGFATAIANTLAGGEVVALDSGGYGPFSIGKSITIAGAPGAHVAISVFSGTGITVAAGAADRVVLRGLFLTGLGGLTGIFFQAGGSLHVESVVAAGFTGWGLDAQAAAGRLVVRDSVFRHNGVDGVRVLGSLRVAIADSRADRNNSVGFFFAEAARGSIVRSASAGNAGAGFLFQDGVLFAVSDSVAEGNGAGVSAIGFGTQATLSAVVLSDNGNEGLRASSTAVARIGGSTATGNAVGLSNASGTLESFGDNMVRGNTTETQGTITTVAKT